MGRRPRVRFCSIVALLCGLPVMAVAPSAGQARAAAVPRAPAAAVAAGEDYVALGDSYSAGVGASGMRGLCLRSEKGYPNLWAEEIDAGSFRTVACFGADTGDVREDQLGALSSSTEVVTLSVGGNDVDFATTMITCTLLPVSLCLDKVQVARQKIRDELPAKLERTYDDVRDGAPSAQVLVLGYPRLFEEPAGCPGGPALAKRQALNDAADELSGVVAAAARDAGFRYIDVRGVFAGHGVCAAEPWINGAALSVGAFHPNATGYRDGYLAALP